MSRSPVDVCVYALKGGAPTQRSPSPSVSHHMFDGVDLPTYKYYHLYISIHRVSPSTVSGYYSTPCWSWARRVMVRRCVSGYCHLPPGALHAI
eukprot:1739817-Prymnesium_polylepis.2